MVVTDMCALLRTKRSSLEKARKLISHNHGSSMCPWMKCQVERFQTSSRPKDLCLKSIQKAGTGHQDWPNFANSDKLRHLRHSPPSLLFSVSRSRSPTTCRTTLISLHPCGRRGHHPRCRARRHRAAPTGWWKPFCGGMASMKEGGRPGG